MNGSENRGGLRGVEQRKYTTFELFERYWVFGETVDTDITRRGIPRRSQSDSQRLRTGSVSVEELWDDYLTDFQVSLAKELRRLHVLEMRDEIDDE